MGVLAGIDLGTTNSAIARIDEHGRPVVIPNREGKNITPSVIAFSADPPAVGDEAKELARLGGDDIASYFKPRMGDPHFLLSFHGRDYTATDLSAIILRRLKQDAEASLGEPIDAAVITVPAYFADAQRTATIEAGRRAGLRVARIINEPTAAALAYGVQKTSIDENILIYDLGGGTFDVTTARVSPDAIEVRSTAGDHDLGGKNWDDRIAMFLSEKFAADTGIDPLDDPIALNEVLVRSEQAKWTLSERTATRVTLQLGTERRTYELTRQEFEIMTSSLLDRTKLLTEEALAAAELRWSDLAGVLLVGGSTRMPMVRSFVALMSGKPPRVGVNVDEAVALGAAIQAALEAGIEPGDARPKLTLVGSKRIHDVMSHSLGVVAENRDGTAYINDILIPKNTPIPTSRSKSYSHETHRGASRELDLFLTQGESSAPLDCTILGKYVFSGIEPTDERVNIDVEISYDDNGVVKVKAIQRDTGAELPYEVVPVPDDVSWLGRPPTRGEERTPPPMLQIFLLIDVSSSMSGEPLEEAQAAAREFLDKCDFTRAEVGLIAFSDRANLSADASDNPRKVHAAIGRLEADGTTNLSDAIETARERLAASDRRKYMVILTDGYPDAPTAAIDEAKRARDLGIEIVAIGMGEADGEYLRKIASTDEGSIFAHQGELVATFGRIARVIAEGGRGLRKST